MITLEAIADAISYINRAYSPDSETYHLRNPGLLKAYSFRQLASTDEHAHRIFTSFTGGYRALISDLEFKIQGTSRARVSTLQELLASYRITSAEQIFEAIDFIQRALKDESISASTNLKYFLEQPNGLNPDTTEQPDINLSTSADYIPA